jgi:hypothetical protein
MRQAILMEDSDMTATKGFVVPPGGGKRLDSPTPDRVFDLKLLGARPARAS